MLNLPKRLEGENPHQWTERPKVPQEPVVTFLFVPAHALLLTKAQQVKLTTGPSSPNALWKSLQAEIFLDLLEGRDPQSLVHCLHSESTSPMDQGCS